MFDSNFHQVESGWSSAPFYTRVHNFCINLNNFQEKNILGLKFAFLPALCVISLQLILGTHVPEVVILFGGQHTPRPQKYPGT